MKEPAPLPFLERHGYLRRRLLEALRLLPFVGLLFLLLPLLWTTGSEDGAASTARGGIYVFVVWAALIAAAAGFARRINREDKLDAASPDLTRRKPDSQ